MAELLMHPYFLPIMVGAIIPIVIWFFIISFLSDFKTPSFGAFIAFVACALTVPLVIPVQRIVADSLLFSGPMLTIALVLVEEVAKMGAIIFVAFSSNWLKDPVDYPILLITGSLGFAAFENVLFLINPHFAGDTQSLLALGQIRILGATVVHALSGGISGLLLGTFFESNIFVRIMAGIYGLGLATGLHTFFNVFVNRKDGGYIIGTITVVWIVGLIIATGIKRLAFFSKPEEEFFYSENYYTQYPPQQPLSYY
jgi:RsiW-degrading membrane proteinase PrsW (M82 family)